jgi:2-dehydropantoate 2-reductase
MNLSNVVEAACSKEHLPADVVAAAREEGIAALTAAGMPYISDEEDRARRADHLRIRPVRGELRGGGSAWQSLARRAGRTEADFLNGEIAMLGRQFGVATPVNIALQHQARKLATSGAEPGSMTPDELRVAVGLPGGSR